MKPLTKGGLSAIARLADKEEFCARLADFLARDEDGKWCVAAIDIEHFKLFNEWYGTQRGDALLEKLAACLLDMQRETGCLAGYFGNDDFFVCLPDDEAKAKQLHSRLQGCIDVGDGNVNFFVSLGLCPVDAAAADAQTLCNYAQIAAAAHMGGGGYVCRFNGSMLEKLRWRQEMLSEIDRGLQNREFCFFLQPKCNSMTYRIIGMEALVRWRHPQRGYVAPGEFIPLLEQTGQITRLDMYVWDAVCQMLHRWQENGLNMVPVSVNVSMADISVLNVAQVFSDLVEKYSLEPKFISIEITESVMAKNIELVQNTILALHRKGFIVLMDDFGSGYSSLNMLKDTSVDVLKLDMKFIDITPENREKSLQIVSSVIEMAHRLNMPVVAEGVETQEQVFTLQALDCLYTQGYYFFRPMEVEQAEKLLSERPENEAYWDLRRDIMQRDHRVLGNTLVSEQTAAMLQSFQIVSENVLELSRLNLMTGEYRIVARSPNLVGTGMEGVRTLSEYCDRLIGQGGIPAPMAEYFRKFTSLEYVRKMIFSTNKALSTRFRALNGGNPSPIIASIMPCNGCSEQNPWAVVLILNLPEL